MLLDPKARGLITLKDMDQVNFPDIYLPNTPDGSDDTILMAQAVFDMIQLFAQNPNSAGPGRRRSIDAHSTRATNVAVVDASLIPTNVVAHPVGTIMAVADRAGHFRGALELSNR